MRTIITADPPETAYTNEYVQKALDELTADGVDVMGADFEPDRRSPSRRAASRHRPQDRAAARRAPPGSPPPRPTRGTQTATTEGTPS